jgi:hypothetical protein
MGVKDFDQVKFKLFIIRNSKKKNYLIAIESIDTK